VTDPTHLDAPHPDDPHHDDALHDDAAPEHPAQHASRPPRRRGLAAATTAAALVVAGAVGYVAVDRLTSAPRTLACTTPSPASTLSSDLITAAPRPAMPAEPGSLPEDCWPSAFPGDTPTPTQAAPEPTAPPLVNAAGPDTTGVPAGVTLAAGAPGTFDEDGLVIEGQHIVGDVTLTGDGQVLRNSRVEGHVIVRGAGSTIEDAEVGALSVSGARSFTARRMEVFGSTGRDGVHITSGGDTRAADVVIEASWIHSPKVDPEAHYDGVQVRGVDRLTLRGNTIDLGTWAPEYNAAVFLEEANGGNVDVVVEGNVVNGGGYSVYVEGTNVSFVDNRFGRDSKWGLVYPEHDPFTAEGNIWADSGERAPLP